MRPAGPDRAVNADRDRAVNADRDRAVNDASFRRLRDLPAGSAPYARIRECLVVDNAGLARNLARRYRGRDSRYHGRDSLEDLEQVAVLGLIKAVDRFDPEHGVPFESYAVPTILGELRRHFRDSTWDVSVPRRLQELRTRILAAREDVAQRLGHLPNSRELAAHTDLSAEDIELGLVAVGAYGTRSLDAADDGRTPLSERIGVDDAAIESVEYRVALRPLLRDLPAREREILRLRFFGNLSQAQIGSRLGISQVQVSRLLTRTLAGLRHGLLGDGVPPAQAPTRAVAVAVAVATTMTTVTTAMPATPPPPRPVRPGARPGRRRRARAAGGRTRRPRSLSGRAGRCSRRRGG
jgi:RNA polymerase sigma-B factor